MNPHLKYIHDMPEDCDWKRAARAKNFICAIKEVRFIYEELSNGEILGLKHAKDFVESYINLGRRVLIHTLNHDGKVINIYEEIYGHMHTYTIEEVKLRGSLTLADAFGLVEKLLT